MTFACPNCFQAAFCIVEMRQQEVWLDVYKCDTHVENKKGEHVFKVVAIRSEVYHCTHFNQSGDILATFANLNQRLFTYGRQSKLLHPRRKRNKPLVLCHVLEKPGRWKVGVVSVDPNDLPSHSKAREKNSTTTLSKPLEVRTSSPDMIGLASPWVPEYWKCHHLAVFFIDCAAIIGDEAATIICDEAEDDDKQRILRSVTLQIQAIKKCITNFNRKTYDRLVDKADSMTCVWPGPCPSPPNVVTLVKWLREATGDQALKWSTRERNIEKPILDAMCQENIVLQYSKPRSTWKILVQPRALPTSGTGDRNHGLRKRIPPLQILAGGSSVTEKENLFNISDKNPFDVLGEVPEQAEGEGVSLPSLLPSSGEDVGSDTVSENASADVSQSTLPVRVNDNSSSAEWVKVTSFKYAKLGDKMGALYRSLRMFAGGLLPSIIQHCPNQRQEHGTASTGRCENELDGVQRSVKQLHKFSDFLASIREKKTAQNFESTAFEWIKSFIKDRFNAAWLLCIKEKNPAAHVRKLKRLAVLAGLETEDLEIPSTENMNKKERKAVLVSWLQETEEKLIDLIAVGNDKKTRIVDGLKESRQALQEKFDSILDFEKSLDSLVEREGQDKLEALGESEIEKEKEAKRLKKKELRQWFKKMKSRLKKAKTKSAKDKVINSQQEENRKQFLRTFKDLQWEYFKAYRNTITTLLETTYGENDNRCFLSKSYLLAEGKFDKKKIKVTCHRKSLSVDNTPAQQEETYTFDGLCDDNEILMDAFVKMNEKMEGGGGKPADPSKTESLFIAHVFGASPRKIDSLIRFVFGLEDFLKKWTATVANSEAEEDDLLKEASKLEEDAHTCVCTTAVTYKKIPKTIGSNSQMEDDTDGDAENEIMQDETDFQDSTEDTEDTETAGTILLKKIFTQSHTRSDKAGVTRFFREVIRPLCTQYYSPYLYEVLDLPHLVKSEENQRLMVHVSKGCVFKELHYTIRKKKPPDRCRGYEKCNLDDLERRLLYTPAASATSNMGTERLWVRFHKKNSQGKWIDASMLPELADSSYSVPSSTALDGISEFLKRRLLFHNVKNDFKQLVSRNKSILHAPGKVKFYLGPPAVTIREKSEEATRTSKTKKVTLYISKWSNLKRLDVMRKTDDEISHNTTYTVQDVGDHSNQSSTPKDTFLDNSSQSEVYPFKIELEIDANTSCFWRFSSTDPWLAFRETPRYDPRFEMTRVSEGMDTAEDIATESDGTKGQTKGKDSGGNEGKRKKRKKKKKLERKKEARKFGFFFPDGQVLEELINRTDKPIELYASAVETISLQQSFTFRHPARLVVPPKSSLNLGSVKIIAYFRNLEFPTTYTRNSMRCDIGLKLKRSSPEDNGECLSKIWKGPPSPSSPQPKKQATVEWKKKLIGVCTTMFSRCADPKNMFTNLKALVDHYVSTEMTEADKETARANLGCKQEELEILLRSFSKLKKSLEKNQNKKSRLRYRLTKCIRSVFYIHARPTATPASSSANPVDKPNEQRWEFVVNDFEHEGVFANRWLQKLSCGATQDCFRASGVDKGGTIVFMIYDANNHQLFRVGLGFGKYLDRKYHKPRTRLQSISAKNPEDVEGNKLRSKQIQKLFDDERREVDKIHDMTVRILLSRDHKTHKRNFQLIACPKMNIKGMTQRSGRLSKRWRRIMRKLRFGDFDNKLERAAFNSRLMFGEEEGCRVDARAEHFTTGTCTCCGKYSPGTGRNKVFRCKDASCVGSIGILRDGQGARNICVQALFDKSVEADRFLVRGKQNIFIILFGYNNVHFIC